MPRLVSFLLIIGFWVLSAVITTGQLYLKGAEEVFATEGWLGLFLRVLPENLLWALYTPLVLWLGDRFRFTGGKFKISVLIHLTAFTLMLLIYNLVIFPIQMQFYSSSFTFNDLYMLFFSYLAFTWRSGLLIYGLILAIQQLFFFFGKLRQKEHEAAELNRLLVSTQLQTLRMKLQPHFLFNTLNSINTLAMKQDTEAVRKVIDKLAELLRLSLYENDEQFVTLRQEMQAVDCYLDIQEVRFGERLRIAKRIEGKALDSMVPTLLLQPLVENSIKHGLSKRIDSGVIEISARRNGEVLEVSVADDGPGLPDGWRLETHGGTGLRNTLERLDILFRDSYTFEIGNREPRGVLVKLRIPLPTVDGLQDLEKPI